MKTFDPKEYYLKNKEKISEYNKEYNLKNKEKRRERNLIRKQKELEEGYKPRKYNKRYKDIQKQNIDITKINNIVYFK